jgi:hypothetical protein
VLVHLGSVRSILFHYLKNCITYGKSLLDMECTFYLQLFLRTLFVLIIVYQGHMIFTYDANRNEFWCCPLCLSDFKLKYADILLKLGDIKFSENVLSSSQFVTSRWVDKETW